MSRTRTVTHHTPHPPKLATPRSLEEQLINPFDKYEEKLRELSERIIPKQPYLITIPSDRPFRRHTNDPCLWHKSTPFSRDEELLQYMSLLPHQDDNEELMRVEGDRIDEDGRLITGDVSPSLEQDSRPTTPTVAAGPKKKITLGDYKKNKSTLNTPERKPVDDSLRRQALKSHKEEVDRKVVIPSDDHAQKVIGSPPIPPSANEARRSTSKGAHEDIDADRPRKRRRVSEELDNQRASLLKIEEKREPAERQGIKEEVRLLPTLLSPTLPSSKATTKEKQAPAVSKHETRGIPTLLSPALPPELEKILTMPDSTAGTKVSPAVALNLAEDITVTGAAAAAAGPGRVPLDTQSSTKPVKSIKMPASARKPSVVDDSGLTAVRPDSESKQTCVVVLKFKKENRKRVHMLLRMKSKGCSASCLRKDGPMSPEKSMVMIGKDKEHGDIPTVRVDTPNQDKKRSSESILQTPAKRQRIDASATLQPPTLSNTSSTPKLDITKTPTPNSHQTKQSLFSTPTPTPKPLSTAMQRVASTETNLSTSAKTPSQDTNVTKNSTPLVATNTNSTSSQLKLSPAPSSTPRSTGHVDSKAWTSWKDSIYTLGRQLKREGSNAINDAQTKPSTANAQPILIHIEALLCFVLNSAAESIIHPASPAQWLTIVPYHSMVRRQSRAYPHLHGLVVLLGAMIRQLLQQEQIRQLSKLSVPDEQVAAPTPGSDGTTRTNEDPVKAREAFLKSRDELAQNTRELRVAWLEAGKMLPLDVIEDQYPKTWKGKSRPSARTVLSNDRLDPKALPKNYYLPLDVTTTVFEATHFSLTFMNEWAMLEGTKWKSRIQL